MRVRIEPSTAMGRLNPFAIPKNTVLDCGESGSTLRFLLPLCLLSNTPVVLTGSKRLLERPVDVYARLCQERRLLFAHSGNAITVCGGLSADRFCVPGDVSSQFVSGLMMALPLLHGDSTVEMVGIPESKPYIEMTRAVQNRFNVCVDIDGKAMAIRGNQRYRSLDYTVEGDCSNAAYLEAFNLTGSDVKVFGLSREIPQGDWVYKDFLTKMQNGIRTFDLSDCPDLGPILFALSAIWGEMKFVGTRRLRMKESDRIDAMACELAKCGVSVTAEENTVYVHGGNPTPPTEPLYGHKDHRIVMALTLLGSRLGGVIEGAEAVAKSYPEYFDEIRLLGIKATEV